MIINETKWPKQLNKWRIVKRTDVSKTNWKDVYQTQAKLGLFSDWQDLGKSHDEFDDAHAWVLYQCGKQITHKENVVWEGSNPNNTQHNY